MENGNYKILPIIPIADAVREADAEIKKAMTGVQAGLHCRWPKLVKGLNGGFRFGEFYLLAGASGSGKSMLLNMLLLDFCDPYLNGHFPQKFKILHFAFEMPSKIEVLRSYSSMSGINYRHLVDPSDPLDEAELAMMRMQTAALRNNNTIHYVEHTGRVGDIDATVRAFQEQNPDCKLIISLDHTILADIAHEQSEVELVSNICKLAIVLRKELGCMVIYIGQLSDKIEEQDRRDPNKPNLHYPTKRDIHGSKASYRNADCVMVLHAPEQLGLEYYGRNQFPTKGLLALHILKMRNGVPGVLRLKQDLSKGIIQQWQDDIITTHGAPSQ